MTIKEQLGQARANTTIVRVYRSGLEDGWVDGYVAALGDNFFAMEIFDKAGRLDGYNCFRYRDISELLSPAPHIAFLSKALLARGMARCERFEVDVRSLTTLLHSAARSFPLIAIFYEGEDDVCWIGKVVSVTDQQVQLLEITSDGTFEKAATPHLLGGITRVDFGGSYEETLHLVSRGN